jgi:hypothetical protein
MFTPWANVQRTTGGSPNLRTIPVRNTVTAYTLQAVVTAYTLHHTRYSLHVTCSTWRGDSRQGTTAEPSHDETVRTTRGTPKPLLL